MGIEEYSVNDVRGFVDREDAGGPVVFYRKHGDHFLIYEPFIRETGKTCESTA